jgi:hypothetical protein
MHMCREGSEEWIFGRVHIHPPPPPCFCAQSLGLPPSSYCRLTNLDSLTPSTRGRQAETACADRVECTSVRLVDG